MPFDTSDLFILILLLIPIIVIYKGVKIVPQQQAWVIERLGKFSKQLDAGFHVIIPFVDKVGYKHSLKEEAIDVRSQSAITKDNVTLNIDGVLYVKIIDAQKASYGVADPYYALTQLAQTTMRSEIGKIAMDRTFAERDTLNSNIVFSINDASTTWGIQCMRYEIKDINPPRNVLEAMEQQVTAERNKRAQILESEGHRQADINVAEGKKQQVVLESEAALTDQVNRAKGEAEAIFSVAEATAKGIREVASAIQENGGNDAVSLRVAEQYVGAFSKIAQETNTVLLPANVGDAGSMVAQALTVFENIKGKKV